MNKRGIGIFLIVIIALLAIGAFFLVSKTQIASPQYSPPGNDSTKKTDGNFVNPKNATNIKKLPDLIVQEFSASHSYNGSTYLISPLATIKNIGDAIAKESYARFNVNYQIDNTRYTFTRSLGAGQSTTINSSRPFGVPAGIYLLTANADWFNNVTEKSENNNERIINLTIGPDLIVSKINFTSRQQGNATNYTVTFNALVRNIGTYTAGTSKTGFVVLYGGAQAISTDAIPANSERLVIAVFSLAPGNRTLTVKADTFNYVAEADETNNERKLDFNLP